MSARSYLFVPGDSEKKMLRASEGTADAIMLDLEDSISEFNKVVARERVAEFLANADTQTRQYWVRINPLDGAFALADIVAVASLPIRGVFLPKPSSVADIQRLDHYLTALEAQHQRQQGPIKIMTVAETASGMLAQSQFPGSSARLAAMTWGAEDMAADLGAPTNRDAAGKFFTVHQMNRALCLVVATAGSVDAVDTPCMDFKNEQTLLAECKCARQEGFVGKMAIHPTQIDVINAAFTPSAEEVSFARRVVAAFDSADGAGTVGLDGKMLDRPHLRQALRVLAQQ